MTGPSRGAALRALMARTEPLLLPLVYDAMTARFAEAAGFEALFMSGAGVESTLLAHPDLGFITMTEAADQARRISMVTSVPLMADCETGFGGAPQTQRTIREFEMNDVAAMVIEDQTTVKRAPYIGGSTVVSRGEFVGKIKAAVQARRDPNTVIVARTDAHEAHGLDDAVYRMNAAAEAGAELCFVSSVLTMSAAERATLASRVSAPLVGVGTVAGVPQAVEEGFSVILVASLRNVVAKAVKDYLADTWRLQDDYALADQRMPSTEVESFMGIASVIREAVEVFGEPTAVTTLE